MKRERIGRETAPFPSVFRGCCKTSKSIVGAVSKIVMNVRLAIPLLIQEAWLRHQEKERSLRSGADGVVRIDEVYQNAFFRRGSILDYPVCSFKAGFATSS